MAPGGQAGEGPPTPHLPAYASQMQVRVSCNGVPAVFLVDDKNFVCRCSACQRREARDGHQVFTPTEYERHAGMAASKKWKYSVRVEDPEYNNTGEVWRLANRKCSPASLRCRMATSSRPTLSHVHCTPQPPAHTFRLLRRILAYLAENRSLVVSSRDLCFGAAHLLSFPVILSEVLVCASDPVPWLFPSLAPLLELSCTRRP